MTRIVIVGAGPAGMNAALALAVNGIRPVVLDEGRRPGGQIYRVPSEGLEGQARKVLGGSFPDFNRIHQRFAAARGSMDYRPQTLAWNIADGKVWTNDPSGNVEAIPYDAIILATGAIDRTLPVPGWTKPGVFTLGGAQVLLKEHGSMIGRKVLFCGSSPLLPLVAYQYHRLGGSCAGVVDTAGLTGKLLALPDLASVPGKLASGVGYLAWLASRRVPLWFGARLLAIEGDERVSGVRLRTEAGRIVTMTCDAVALGFGLAPETQLAELAGAGFRFDRELRSWIIPADADGRVQKGLYLAGDGHIVGGAEAAEAGGELAALACLADFGLPFSGTNPAALRAKIRRQRRFQRGLRQAFDWSGQAALAVGEDTVICRCENIVAAELHGALDMAIPPAELNRLKSVTRCGMGRCQGRFCEAGATALVHRHRPGALEAIGKLRVQAPVKPIWVAKAPEGD